jgi:xylulokinase
MAGKAVRAFIGIDAGTTGTTVAVYDEKGHEIATGYKEYACSFPRAGWVEQDFADVWDGICVASKQAIKAANLAPSSYKSVGFSSQRGTFGLLDAKKQALAPSIVWNDGRAQAYEGKFAETLSAADYQKHTGMPLAAAWAACKVAWMRDNRPDVFEKTRWVVNGQEYFLNLLGADDWTTDPASLTLNGMMDIRKLDWSDQVLKLCGLTRDMVPPVGRTATQAGVVSKFAAAATGIPTGTPICRGAGDQQCAAIGAGIIKQGMAEFTVGTSAVMVAHVDSVDRVTGDKLFLGGHGVPGMWDLEGAAFAAGVCLRWWRDILGIPEQAAAKKAKRSPYAEMVDLAMKAPAGAKGLIFHPFMQGQVTPYYDVTAKGGYLGMRLDHDRADVMRAVLEGVSNEMRMIVDTFQSGMKGGVTEFRLTGGGTKSPGFVQIMTDVIGLPAGVPKVRECTVLGAAILGAVGAGQFSNVAEAAGAMVSLESMVEPTRATRGLYEDQHALFKSGYSSLNKGGAYQAMYDYNAKYF